MLFVERPRRLLLRDATQIFHRHTPRSGLITWPTLLLIVDQMSIARPSPLGLQAHRKLECVAAACPTPLPARSPRYFGSNFRVHRFRHTSLLQCKVTNVTASICMMVGCGRSRLPCSALDCLRYALRKIYKYFCAGSYEAGIAANKLICGFTFLFPHDAAQEKVCPFVRAHIVSAPNVRNVCPRSVGGLCWWCRASAGQLLTLVAHSIPLVCMVHWPTMPHHGRAKPPSAGARLNDRLQPHLATAFGVPTTVGSRRPDVRVATVGCAGAHLL